MRAMMRALLQAYLLLRLAVTAFTVTSNARAPFSSTAVAAAAAGVEFALLFDCDGVILETEEFHRLAYNEAFRTFDLSIDGKRVEWSVGVFCAPHVRCDVLRTTSRRILC